MVVDGYSFCFESWRCTSLVFVQTNRRSAREKKEKEKAKAKEEGEIKGRRLVLDCYWFVCGLDFWRGIVKQGGQRRFVLALWEKRDCIYWGLWKEIGGCLLDFGWIKELSGYDFWTFWSFWCLEGLARKEE